MDHRISSSNSFCALSSASFRASRSREPSPPLSAARREWTSARAPHRSTPPARLSPAALFLLEHILSFCSCALRSPRSFSFSRFSLSFARCSFSLSFFFCSASERLGAIATGSVQSGDHARASFFGIGPPRASSEVATSGERSGRREGRPRRAGVAFELRSRGLELDAPSRKRAFRCGGIAEGTMRDPGTEKVVEKKKPSALRQSKSG